MKTSLILPITCGHLLLVGPISSVVGFQAAVHWSRRFSPMVGGRFPPSTVVSTISASSSSSTNDETLKNWKERAAQLRKEVADFEEARGVSSTSSSTSPNAAPPPEYRTLSDSVWMVSYRFSDEPEPSDKDAKDTVVTTTKQRNIFSGKLTLKFKQDGYTDIVHPPPQGKEEAVVVKAWGWDVETSNENKDDTKYLLFSLDVLLPESTITQRFYFQARQQVDNRGMLSFCEGTVTVKQDVVRETARWGLLFAPAGILAQFRYVGDFIAKPTVAP